MGGKIDGEKVIGLLLIFIGLFMYDKSRKEISKGEHRIAAMQELEAEALPTYNVGIKKKNLK